MPTINLESLEQAIAVAKQSALTTGEPLGDIDLSLDLDGDPVVIISPADEP